MTPANRGDDRLVPPRRYSLYAEWPSGNVWVWPTRNPVFGSATIATSGTARPLNVAPFPWLMLSGTTPVFQDGWAKRLRVPPPEPVGKLPGGAVLHCTVFWSRFVRAVSQPVS